MRSYGLLALALLVGSPAFGNLVVDGNFQYSPYFWNDFPDTTHLPQDQAWIMRPDGDAFWRCYPGDCYVGFGYSVAPFSDDLRFDSGYIFQTLSTVPGTDYKLSFVLESTGGNPVDYADVRISFGAQSVEEGVGHRSYLYNFDVTAASSSTTLMFQITTYNVYLYIQNVSVEAVPTSSGVQATPEPATWLAGLAALTLLAVKRASLLPRLHFQHRSDRLIGQ
jgi:hypothetical protein